MASVTNFWLTGNARRLLASVAGWAAWVGAMHTPSAACDNPVYRYALEHWSPADYELVRVRTAEPTAEETAVWESLQQMVQAPAARPNLRLRDILRDQVDNPILAQQLTESPGALFVLLAPGDPPAPRVIWQGPSHPSVAASLVSSPVRQRIAECLLGNDAVVWIKIVPGTTSTLTTSPSGSPSGEDPLESALTKYAAAISASDRDATPAVAEPSTANSAAKPDKSLYWPPRFSVLTVGADDPQEEILLAILRGLFLEDESPAQPGGETVFPIFGRGRALGGVSLTAGADGPRAACDFLTGTCSCQVKEMNPGHDLLLRADWSVVQSVAKPSQQPLFSLLALEPIAPTEAPPQPPAVPQSHADDDNHVAPDSPPSGTVATSGAPLRPANVEAPSAAADSILSRPLAVTLGGLALVAVGMVAAVWLISVRGSS